MLNKLKIFGLSLLSSLSLSLPLEAAEKINFIYTPIKLSLSVESLELFAEENIVNSELGFYFGLAGVDEETKTKIREILTKPSPIDGVTMSRFLNTPTGELLLTQLGKILSIPGGRNGKYPLRGALVQGALSNEGLTILSFLQYFPTDLQVNVDRGLIAGEYLQILGRATNELVLEMKELSSEAISEENYDFNQLPNLTEPGEYGVIKDRLELNDTKRNRSYYAIVYKPQRWREGKTPVVIISHGLGSQAIDFDYIGKHLASHGYYVALPQHVGSDNKYFQEALEGYHRQLYEAESFINRPADISFLLDELESLNQTEYNNRLNLQDVGIMGHSFGGYTALAVGGARIDFYNIERYCNREIWGPNLSLLLQCRALELPRQDYDFRDKRIKALFVVNPVASVVFGSKGLKTVNLPILFGSGTSDPATPGAIEQLRPFVWIPSQDKYLAVVEGQAHVNSSKLDASAKAVLKSIPDLTLPKQSLLDNYARGFTLGFFDYYLMGDSSMKPFISSAYAEYLSREPNFIYIIDRRGAIPLSELFNRFVPQEVDRITPAEIVPIEE